MPENYVTLSLETHLFFARIMKEHSLFLAAGFPCKDTGRIREADYFRQQFENLLSEVVRISNGRVGNCILTSDELVTEFTPSAEKMTESLSGIPINSTLTRAESHIHPGSGRENSNELLQLVHQLNERSVELLNGLIQFKQSILEEVSKGKLFTFNYPLLIRHIMREAKLYLSTIESLMQNRRLAYREFFGTEEFWNQIMMEHALFIRGLLDPSEEKLIAMANDFAMDYRKLLEQAKERDCRANRAVMEETLKYRDFKATGTKGILNCEIASLILPLLADHVLREANHYIRILKNS